VCNEKIKIIAACGALNGRSHISGSLGTILEHSHTS